MGTERERGGAAKNNINSAFAPPLLFPLSSFPLLAILEKLAEDPERREFFPWDFGGERALRYPNYRSVLTLEIEPLLILYPFLVITSL